MKKIIVYTITSLICFTINAQDPYIGSGSGEGLGQYGYIEKDAVTFVSLYRNTHGNVRYLGARWWVDAGSGGTEWIYNTNHSGDNWQCTGDNSASKTTQNFDPSNFGGRFVAGANAYVSVRATYCDGATGGNFNERQFQIFDFEVKNDYTTGGLFDANGNCGQTATKGSNIVGSFIINVGSLSGKSLNRLFFQNTGSFAETTQIPNDGFKLFYESSTGSESFNGSESSATLYGDWGGDATNNNIYGAENLNIPLSGSVRFYIVLCDIVDSSVDPTSIGSFPTAVSINILNDGLSLAPKLNTNYDLARINSTSLNYTSPLPVKYISFTAQPENAVVHLKWQTAEEISNNFFEIQRSVNAKDFEKVGVVEAQNAASAYSFTDNSAKNGTNYYRLKQVDNDGTISFSKIISAEIKSENILDILVFPNPTSKSVIIKNVSKNSIIELISVNGNVLNQQVADSESVELDVSKLKTGIYFIKNKQLDGGIATKKLMIE